MAGNILMLSLDGHLLMWKVVHKFKKVKNHDIIVKETLEYLERDSPICDYLPMVGL